MSDRPNDPGLTSGDPLSPGPEVPRHESGLPGVPPSAPPEAPGYHGGYTSAPPPGARGGAPPAASPVTGRYRLAGWWSRVGAAIIDGIIITIGAVLISLLFAVLFNAGFADDDGDASGGEVAAAIVGLLLWVVAVAIVVLLYAPWMMAKTNGKTLGRMAVGNRVVRANGQPMTFGWAMLREVAVKTLLFGFGGSVTFGLANLADVLWPLWDDENRALHDFIVDTRTVKD
jgi:uncharacterized RDD family membrane protein YckC